MTNKQKREQAREAARLTNEKRRKQLKRKQVAVRVIVTTVVLAVFAGIGTGVWVATRPEGPGPVNMLSGGALFEGGDGQTSIVKTAGMPAGSTAVPTDPASTDAPARIRTYIDFSCEFCKMFEDANGAQIEEMVASGQATLEVFPVAILGPYSVRAGSAAACVAAEQPESFFDMLRVMYANQPPEGGAGLTNAEILDLWSTGGITASDELTSCVNGNTYAKWIQARTESVVSDPDIVNPATGRFGTPTVFVNDVRYEPTDLSSPSEFAAFVAANSTGSGSPSTPSPTPTPAP